MDAPPADLDAARAKRMEHLTLLQDLWNILSRNSFELGDKLCRDAIKHDFRGFLDLRVTLDEKRGNFNRLERLDMYVTMRLRRPDTPEAPDSISFPVDAATLKDMYRRMEEPEQSTGEAAKAAPSVVTIDCEKEPTAR